MGRDGEVSSGQRWPERDGPMPTRLQAARHLFVDRRGGGMRVSTHPEHGVVVLSLWRGDRCVGTFQLEPDEAARLAAVLAQGLASMATTASGPAADASGA